jgi:hypothetical protein
LLGDCSRAPKIDHIDHLDGDTVLRPNAVIWDDPMIWRPYD